MAAPRKHPAKVCAYHLCQRVFRPTDHPERAKYCTRACGHADRPSQARVDAGRKGGRISGERKRRKALARSFATWTRVRQEAYRLGYSAGYEAAARRMLAREVA